MNLFCIEKTTLYKNVVREGQKALKITLVTTNTNAYAQSIACSLGTLVIFITYYFLYCLFV